MCYDIQTSLQREIKLAKRKNQTREYIDRLITEYNTRYPEAPVPSLYWHVSGFAHPALPVIINEDGTLRLDIRQWGLIPRWCKDKPTALKMRTHCLNARSETLFEKPAFKKPAMSNRAVLVVDAFYEHHHFGGRTYPFRIHRKDGQPLLMAALWEDWADPATGEVFPTFTIVTTVGNALMAAIHNNPKMEAGPRMPLLLEDDALDIWLDPHTDLEGILSLRIPLSSGEGSGEGSSGEGSFLTAHPVRPLRGKAALGNVSEAAAPYDYPELAMVMGEILGEG